MEVWKAVADFEGIYEVSDRGRVRSLDRIDSLGRKRKGRVLKPGPNSKGYLYVGLCKNNKQSTQGVHQLVLTAFVGPCPPGMECCHDNGVRDDNRLSNLRWDTKKGNEADKINHGTDRRGEKNPMVKLTKQQVRQAFVLAEQGLTQKQIGHHLGVVPMTVSMILNGVNWQHGLD